jgi:excisionase family DNA binding protein
VLSLLFVKVSIAIALEFMYIRSMIDGYVTTSECAERLGISVGRVQQLVANGRLPAIKVGNTNLIKETDLKLVENRINGRPKKEK